MLLLFFISIVRAIDITGTVIDAQGIAICGVYITLFQQDKQLIQVQTKDDGTYKISSDESKNLFIEASLNHNLQTPIRYPVQSNKQDFKLTLDDITVNGQAVLAKIIGQFNNGDQPLQGVNISYRIEYQDNGIQQFEFTSTSNEQGLSKLYTIYPKSSGILKFLAQSENFWNQYQIKETDEKYVLIVNNQYKSTFSVSMIEGQITVTVLGIVLDKETKKPINDVVVIVTFSTKSKGQLDKKECKTKEDGKFKIDYPTKLWYEFTIDIKFQKQFYSQHPMSSQKFDMDHDDRSKIQYTWDLSTEGTKIELPVEPHVILFGLVLNPKLQKVANLTITLTYKFKDVSKSLDVTTNKDSVWETEELLLEPNEHYELKMKYKNKDNKEFTFDTEFDTTADTQQRIKIDTLYIIEKTDIHIDGEFKKPENIKLKIPYKIDCYSNQENYSNFDEKYNQDFELEEEGDKPQSCSITKGDTQMCQPFTQPCQLKAPDWKTTCNVETISYNLFKQIISGVTKDQAGLVKFIGGAKLTFTIYQKNITNVETRIIPTSSLTENGKFQIEFPVAKNEIEFVTVKATHDDFMDYFKEDILKLPADKDQTWPLDITFNRIELNINFNNEVVLKYIIDTLKQQATLKFMSSQPLMPYKKIYEQKPTTSDGIFKLQFICYQNIEYTSTLELSIDAFKPIMFSTKPFKCVKGEIAITSETLNVEGEFTIKFFDANNQPQSGITATFHTEPISDKLTLTSGADGIITFTDKKLFKNQQYKGFVMYGTKSAEITFDTYTLPVKKSFPEQYIAQEVTYTISGQLKLEDGGKLPNPQNVTITCGNQIVKQGKTDLDGKFSLSFSQTSNYNDVLTCTTKISGDVKEKSFDTTFQKGEHTSSGNVVTTSLLDVKLTLHGKVINPMNKGQKNLDLKLIMLQNGEEKQAYPRTTNDEGIWEIKEAIIKANAQFDLKINFMNAANQKQEYLYPNKYQSSTHSIKPTDTLPFPDTYYQDFEKCHADGFLKNPPKFLPATTIPFNVKCESISKDTKPILQPFDLGIDFKYDFDVNPLVEYDKKLDCLLTSRNEKVAKLNQTIIFEGVKDWKITQEKLKATLIICNITIKGIISDETTINHNLIGFKVVITVHPQQKINHLFYNLHHKFASGTNVDVQIQDSNYQSQFDILNDQLLSADIEVTHDDFNPYKATPILFGKQEETCPKEEIDKIFTQNIALQRIIIKATLEGKVNDNGTIKISEQIPKKPDQNSPPDTVAVSQGKTFQYPFSCYKNVEYSIKFKLTNEQKQQIDYQSDPFICKEKQQINIKSLNDKVDLKLFGTIFDGEKIVEKVKDATVKIEIKFQEKVIQVEEVKTDNDGKYEKKFTLSPNNYQIVYTITHPLFLDLPESTNINLQANSEVEKNFTLKRKVHELKFYGTIFDGDKIVDKLKDATIKIEIKLQEKVIQVEEVKTDKDGKFEKQFSLPSNNYQIVYTITHPQFQNLPPESQNVNLQTKQEIEKNFTLKRVVHTQKVKVSLQDATKKPIQNSSVSTTDFKPKSQDDIVDKTGDKNGEVTVEVQCYKDIKETFKIKIQVGDVVEQKDQEIDCDGKEKSYPIKTSTQYMEIKGSVIDPEKCKGKKGLELKLKTIPSSQSLEMKTDSDGIWKSTFLGKLDQKYEIKVTYNNFEDKEQTESKSIVIKLDETTEHFPDIYYEDKVEIQVSGNVQSKLYQGSLKFHSIQLLDSEGSVIAHSEIDQFSEYELSSKILVSCEKKYKESVFIKASQHFESGSQSLTIEPPKYIYSDINLVVQETAAYQNEIKNFFSKFKIIGTLDSEYNCKDKLERAVQHASVTLTKQQELGSKVRAANHTDTQGRFRLNFFLSKKQVENNIFVWLHFEKEGFTTPYPLLIIPSQYEKFQMDEETITEIDVGYQSISPIKDMGCPDIPIISSKNQLH